MSHTRLPTVTAARNPTASPTRRLTSVPNSGHGETGKRAPSGSCTRAPRRSGSGSCRIYSVSGSLHKKNPTRKARPNPRAFSPQSICPQPLEQRVCIVHCCLNSSSFALRRSSMRAYSRFTASALAFSSAIRVASFCRVSGRLDKVPMILATSALRPVSPG